MTTTTSSNGQVRKTLASQLDRLDAILDTLGEGLNQAVATAVEQAVEIAVREGVSQGVRGALSEILSDPEVRTLIRATVGTQATASDPAPATSTPTTSAGKPGLFGRAWNWTKAKCQKVRQACGRACTKTQQALTTARGGLSLLKPFRNQVLLALGVGTLAGIGVYFAGPPIAALAGWLAGVLSTFAVQAGIAVRKMLNASALTS